MNGTRGILDVSIQKLLKVSMFAMLAATFVIPISSAGASDDEIVRSSRLAPPPVRTGQILVMAEIEHYVEFIVLDCGGTGDCFPQGWADVSVSDGDVTYFGISQENGFISPIGPFHGSSVAIVQGYHVIEEEPLVRCGERYLDPATGGFESLNKAVWIDLKLDAGMFVYENLDAPLLTCYIVSNAI